MAYNPAEFKFSYDGPAFIKATVRLRQTSDNSTVAGADAGIPPIVAGKYVVDFATHGLTPDSYPALVNNEVKATVQLEASNGVVSDEIYSDPFVFKLPDPFDLQLA